MGQQAFGPPPGQSPGPRPLPAEARQFPHAEPQPYHLMLRTWTYAWWKPVVGVLVLGLGFILAASIVLTVVVAIWSAFQSGPWAADVQTNLDISRQVTPAGLLGVNLGLASLGLLVWLILRVGHRLRPRWLTSVAPRMRWRFFLACLGLAVVALAAQVLVGQLVPASSGDDLSGSANALTRTVVVDLVIMLLTQPLQAVAEELVFRGYLLMAFGSLFGSKWVAILATATLFALAHGGQNFPLFFDRFAFGLIAGWLVTRTGGLEAGIALHILNNWLAIGFALLFGDLTASLNASETSWWQILLTVTQSVVYVVLVLIVARRMGLQTRTRPPFTAPGTALDEAPATA